jgi:hypothetical protein
MTPQVEQMQRIIDAREQPLIIAVARDIVRVVADIFDHEDGIVFVDTGWNSELLTTHPFHVVGGKITGNSPWKVGSAIIQTIDDSNDLFFEWYEWINSPDGKRATREAARQGIENDFGFKSER